MESAAVSNQNQVLVSGTKTDSLSIGSGAVVKGQLISKCLFGVFNFSQKTNENMSTWGIVVVKSNFFVRFLRELKMPKRHFENNWPLAGLPFSTLCK